VLLNLVGNAIKFTGCGRGAGDRQGGKRHFAVSVTDTGPGMPDQEQARIFY